MPSHRPLTARRRALRPFGALCACVLLLALAAPIALAGEPHLVRPPAPDRDSATPHFVTETNDTKWDDCEWASAAMLIEKWTGEPVDRRALRAAANVKKGGSSLRDVTRGASALLDLHVRFSPNGGDPMTWRQLLARLSDGGGAVIEGAYSRMPVWFRRWDRKFAASGSVKSAHAVYVERYQPRRGRVWLMDPLGRDGYAGEWISVAALEYFSYTSSGLVHAAATPARLPPLAISAVKLGQPTIAGQVVAGSPALLVVPLARDRRRQPRIATVWVSTTWEKVDPSLPDGPILPTPPAPPAQPSAAAAATPAMPAVPGVPATPDTPVVPGRPATSPAPVDGAGLPSIESARGGRESAFGASFATPAVVGVPIVTGSPKGSPLSPGVWNLQTRIVAPAAPGRYRLTLTLRDRTGKPLGPRTVAPFLPLIVSVHGPYQVSFDAPASVAMADRGISFGVTNTSSAPWVAAAAATQRSFGPLATTPHIVADWLTADGHATPAGDVYLVLAAGATATVALPLPAAPSGATVLRLDFVGPDGRRISDKGGRATLIPLGPIRPAKDPS